MNKLEITSLPTCWAGLYHALFQLTFSPNTSLLSVAAPTGLTHSSESCTTQSTSAPASAPALRRPAPTTASRLLAEIIQPICLCIRDFYFAGFMVAQCHGYFWNPKSSKIERFFFDSCGGKNDLKWCEYSSVVPLEIQRCLLMECFPKPVYYAVYVQYYLWKSLKSEPQIASRVLD